jgi:hypothetical protein
MADRVKLQRRPPDRVPRNRLMAPAVNLTILCYFVLSLGHR